MNRQFVIENARLIFRNFEGREGKYNPPGSRNVGVVLDPEVADAMANEGWKVRVLPPREEGDTETLWLAVKIKYGRIRPHIYLVKPDGLLELDEDSVGMLDGVDIENVDLTILPYHYAASNGKPGGISAYMGSAYITLKDDGLGYKYGSMPVL